MVLHNVKSFDFGNAEIIIVEHEVRKQGFKHHKAVVRIKGTVEPMYMKNEVIDLISKYMGYDPLRVGIYGSRISIDKGNDYFELHWQTGSKEKN